jgi:DNA-binding LytR/AlgR family response regulator
MRVAICDDIVSDRQKLVEYINRYFGENCIDDLELQEYDCAEALLADKTMPDVLFLDIYMEATNGMDAAKQLLAQGYSGGIIFTTTSKEFGAASYEVNALDYLVKPFSYERFLKSIKKSGDAMTSALSYISIPSGRQRVKLFLRELLYVETGIHCLLFHTKRDTIKSPLTMTEAEVLLLSHKNFIRCHRSYIINLNEVENVTDTTVLMTNGDRVLLNAKNAVSLRRQIADFIWKGMEDRLE